MARKPSKEVSKPEVPSQKVTAKAHGLKNVAKTTTAFFKENHMDLIHTKTAYPTALALDSTFMLTASIDNAFKSFISTLKQPVFA